MTVIPDPGNVTESYIDGLSRLWRQTAGLWRLKDIDDAALAAARLPAGSGTAPREASGSMTAATIAENTPTALVLTVGTNTISATGGGTDTLTLPTTGVYTAIALARSGTDVNVGIRFKINGATVGDYGKGTGWNTESPIWTFMPPTVLSAGATLKIEVDWADSSGIGDTGGGTRAIADVQALFYIYYIPTPTYPH